MKRYHFSSTLLLPAPELAGNNFRWIGIINGQHSNGNTEEVNVLVFNVEEVEGIRPMLERELERLQKIDVPAEVDTRNAAFIEQTLLEITSGLYAHKAPKELLEVVSNQAGRAFKADEVIYLSGINRIVS